MRRQHLNYLKISANQLVYIKACNFLLEEGQGIVIDLDDGEYNIIFRSFADVLIDSPEKTHSLETFEKFKKVVVWKGGSGIHISICMNQQPNGKLVDVSVPPGPTEETQNYEFDESNVFDENSDSDD